MAAQVLDDKIFEYALEKKASDLHLSVGAFPIARIDGVMTPIPGYKRLTKEDLAAFFKTYFKKSITENLKKHKEYDFRFELPGKSRFRVNAFFQKYGPSIVFRTIPTKPPTIEELNLPEVLKSLCAREKGLIVVTGPTGSGKSTTLAAMVEHINRNQRKHILTVEDPIEYVFDNKKCLINQREVGTHTHSFANALRGALREDPDIILVGEMRDLETTSLALTAAETGHLVLGTLHTNSASKTIDRIINIYPAHEQAQIRTMLAASLVAVIAQDLLRKKGGGRVAAHEIMIANTPVKSNIRENKLHMINSIIESSRKLGMVTFKRSLQELLDKGVISEETHLEKSKALGLISVDES